MANRYVTENLVELFVSETRVKIIAYAFLKPGEPFHLRKVARETESSVNSVSRELRRLEKLGLFFSKKEGQKKMYYLNPDFRLLKEMQGFIHKELGLGGELIKLLKNIGKVSLIVLSQTFLEGKSSSPEDLDLLIVGEPDMRMIEVCVKNAQEVADKEINYMVMDEQDYQFKFRRRDQILMKALSDQGMVLYKAEDFG